MKLIDFVPFVAAELMGCPDEVIRVNTVKAVMDLCRKAHIWREIQNPLLLVDGQREVDLDVPAGARVVNVDTVYCGDIEMKPTTMKAIGDVLPSWQTTQSNRPIYFIGSEDWTALLVFPLPAAPTQSMTARVEFEPLITATSLPDLIMQRYQDAIEAGTKYRCMLMPKMPWSDTGLAAYWRAEFEKKIDEACIQKLHEGVSGSIRVRPIPFG